MKFKRERASAVIIRDSKVLLIHRVLPNEEYWTFPGGGIEDTESAEEAVIREVAEETNLRVLSCRKIFEDIDIKIDRLNHFFLCETSDGDISLVGGPEALIQSADNQHIPVWVDIDKIPDTKLVPASAKIKFIDFIQNRKLP